MDPPDTRVSPAFLVVTFGSAIAIGALIVYFGIHGQLGGPIP
jgi:hypothetical protein